MSTRLIARRGRSPLTLGLSALATLGVALGPTLPASAAPARPTSAARPSSATPPSSTAPTPSGGELVGDELPYNTCKRQPRNAKFTITLPRETELPDLVNWMMSITCQKFVWDPKLRGGKATILAPEPITVREAYATFYAALETMGLTVEPSGEYFRIVETKGVAGRTVPMYNDDANAPNSDRFVTQLIRVKNGNTKDIVGVLEKLNSEQGNVESVGNLIILTDKGSSIRRLQRIVSELDQPSAGEKIFFYQLKYADANEVADIIREIFGEADKDAKGAKGKAGASPTDLTFNRVIVDERTGTLIIVASERDYAMISRLIKQLDVKLPGGGGRIHVKKLKNADAEEVAQVLSQLATGAKQATENKTNARNSGAAATAASAELFSGDVKVTPDKATRSLVIVASQADYKNLEPVIDQLDAERIQLYFEIYLLEVKLERGLTAGASGHYGAAYQTQAGSGLGFVASVPSQDINSAAINPTSIQGIAGAILGPRIVGSGQLLGTAQDVPAFGAIIQALQSNDDVNVVSEPHMYAADNQEALIEIGRNVPTPGALSFSGAGGQQQSLVPLQSVERQDVTLKITVKPYVNDHETVTLDIELEDRDIEGEPDPRLGVTTTKRRLKLEKIVGRDDQPVVLGGLIRERDSENVQQVPGLGSIPILGWLFKRKVKTKEKVNLLMVLVPHILETPDDVRRIHERRDRERLEFIERETNFKAHELPANVNYRKKAGLLSAINREALRMEEDEDRLRKVEEEQRMEIITGEIGMSPRIIGDVDDGDETATATLRPAASRPGRARGGGEGGGGGSTSNNN
ncbi:MAG: type II secretion system secretin GspD [Nannocystaceae bacterium]|nr:type II secretion system secretin GspD [Myxococcales bacterium]